MKCLICNKTELEKISETELYCPECDKTIVMQNGKAKLQTGKGRVQTIEENLAFTQKELADLKKALFGEDENDWPFS